MFYEQNEQMFLDLKKNQDESFKKSMKKNENNVLKPLVWLHTNIEYEYFNFLQKMDSNRLLILLTTSVNIYKAVTWQSESWNEPTIFGFIGISQSENGKFWFL